MHITTTTQKQTVIWINSILPLILVWDFSKSIYNHVHWFIHSLNNMYWLLFNVLGSEESQGDGYSFHFWGAYISVGGMGSKTSNYQITYWQNQIRVEDQGRRRGSSAGLVVTELSGQERSLHRGHSHTAWTKWSHSHVQSWKETMWAGEWCHALAFEETLLSHPCVCHLTSHSWTRSAMRPPFLPWPGGDCLL